MTTLSPPFAFHTNLNTPTKVSFSTSSSLLLFPCRTWSISASILTNVNNVHKMTKSHETNNGCLTESSLVQRNKGVLGNTAVMLHSIDLSNPSECMETYGYIFRNCRKFDNLELGFQIHAHLIVCGVELCVFLSSQLVEFYCKFGRLDDSRRLFDRMSERNVFSWTSIIGLYCEVGDYEETIELFYLMIKEGVLPDHFIFPKVYKACSELKNYRVGKDVYDYMLSIGFEGNSFVNICVLDMFVKCGKMEVAREFFEKMELKDVIVWNIMISGYASKGDLNRALHYFKGMKLAGVQPDRVTWNSIISGYSQKGKFEEASNFFFKMRALTDFKPNVVSWTALITGSEQNGCSYRALQVFSQMIMERVKPNSITIASAVSACTNLSLLRHGKEIHAYCIKTDALVSDLLVANSLVDLYAKCRTVEVARRKFNSIKQKDLISWNVMLAGYAQKGCREETFELFNEMKSLGVEPDVITWNGLITGYTQNGDGIMALEFFYRMCERNTKPNTITLSGALAACSLVKDLKLGKEIHGFVIRKQIELSTGVGSALITTMYSGCDHMEWACSVFNVLSDKDVVVRNSIISACAQHGQGVSALNFLRGMLVSDIEPNKVTIVSVLPACARLAALRQGKEIHQFNIRRGFDMHIAIWNFNKNEPLVKLKF